jgi:regulatory protein
MAFGKPKPLDAAGLRDYALRLLGARSMSIGELRRKLRERAAEPGDVAGVLAGLREYGVVDDQRYAEMFASSRRDTRGHGRQRVLADLLAKRVAPALAREKVDEAFAGTDETALVENYLARKFRGKNLAQELTDPKRLAQVYRRLRTAGYSAGVSIRVLKRYAAEADALEGLEERDS